MTRWSTQTLLVAVSGAILFAVAHGGSLRTTKKTKNVHNSHQRQLLFADFWSNPFQIAGVAIVPDQVESWCDQNWMDFLYCTIRECPDLDEKCPSTMFYDSNNNNAEQQDQLVSSVNCNTVEKSYCDTYGMEGCCMAKCSLEIQNLAACAIKGKGGKKLKCRAHDCQALAEEEAAALAQAQAEAEAAAAAAAAAAEAEAQAAREAEAAAAAAAAAEAEAQAQAAREAAAAAAAEAEGQAQAQAQAAKEAEAAAAAAAGEEEDDNETTEEMDDQPQINQVEEGVLLTNAGKEEEKIPFLENFQVQLFANRDKINALNGTRVSLGFFPVTFVEAMGRIFFQASGDTTGHELWVMNQARKSPHLVKDIHPGKGSSLDGMLASESAELNGNLLFFADNGIHGKQLWKTNGSEAGTVMVRQIGGISNDYFSKRGVSVVRHDDDGSGKKHSSMIAYNGKVYFTLRIDGKGEKLWVTDGTRAGTHPAVRDSSSILPNSIKFNSLLPETLLDGKTYFVALSSPSESQQLRNNSSSTTAGGDGNLYLYVADGSTDSGSAPQKVSQYAMVEEGQEELVEFDGKIYFSSAGDTLYSTDGTSHGTREVVNPDGGEAFWFPRSLTVVRNILYFWSDCQLWSLKDGSARGGGGENTTATFVLLFDGTNTTSASSCSDELVQFHTRVLFRGGNNQPYITDGTISGTTKLSDATLIPTTSFAVYNNRIAFFAAETSDGFGHDLWATDGTIGNTQVIPGIGMQNQAGLYPHIDNLFVFRKDVYVSIWYLFGPGDEIWRARISGYEEPPVEIEEEMEEESDAGATFVEMMPFEILPSDLEEDEEEADLPTRLTKLTIIDAGQP